METIPTCIFQLFIHKNSCYTSHDLSFEILKAIFALSKNELFAMPIFFQKLIYNYIQLIVVLLKFRSPKIILKTLYFCHNFMCSKLLTLSQQLIAPNYQKLSSYENQRWEKGKLKRKTSWKVSSSLKVFWSFKSWEKMWNSGISSFIVTVFFRPIHPSVEYLWQYIFKL